MEQGKIENVQNVPGGGAEKQEVQCIILSTKGIKITSNLNPDAKEFYPSYLVSQKFANETSQNKNVQPIEPPTLPTKPRKIESMTNMKSDAGDAPKEGAATLMNSDKEQTPELQQSVMSENSEAQPQNEIKTIEAAQCNLTQKNEEVTQNNEEKQSNEAANFSPNDTADKTDIETQKCMHSVEMKVAPNIATIELNTYGNLTSEENKFPLNGKLNAQSIEYCDKKEMLETVQELDCEGQYEEYSQGEEAKHELDRQSNDMHDECMHESGDTESLEVSEISEEVEYETLNDLPDIPEESRECISPFGDSIPESVGDVPYIIQSNLINGKINDATYNTQITRNNADSKAPPPTPNASAEDIIDKQRKSKLISDKTAAAKDEKKKAEKRVLPKRTTNTTSGTVRKPASNLPERSTSRGATSATRAKRISDNTHNPSTTLKAKTDKKPEIPTRASASRSRPPSAKPTTDSNGLVRKTSKPRTMKDNLTVKPNCSTERSAATKPSPAVKKLLSSKPSGTKAKESAGTSKQAPHGSLSSAQQQSERQKMSVADGASVAS